MENPVWSRDTACVNSCRKTTCLLTSSFNISQPFHSKGQCKDIARRDEKTISC